MMAIMIHPHARERMEEQLQVEVYGVDEERDFIVITIVVKYF
jgi:hypothetical protein